MSEDVFRREVSVSLDDTGDGRTLVSRLVPYNEVAEVNDGQGPYKERFLPGAFNAQLNAAHRIKAFLNFRHSQSIGDQIGHAASIEDRQDGLYGELRVLRTPGGDTALELYREGVLNRLSIEFAARKNRIVDGITERLDARLLGVALVPEGAYQGAEVLAVREQIVLPPDPLLQPLVFPAGLAERLSARVTVPGSLLPRESE